MGLACTQMLHSELVEHWQRVVGSWGPRSPRVGPTEPITQGCQRTAFEWGWGLRRETMASTGFLGSPPPLLFQVEAMGQGTCQSPEQAHLNATSLGPEFRTFQPLPWDLSLSQYLQSCFRVHWVRDSKMDKTVFTLTKHQSNRE